MAGTAATTNTTAITPIIGITGCHEAAADPAQDLARWYTKTPYINVIENTVGGAPLLLYGPQNQARREVILDRWLETLDGVMVTGSPSNIEPHHYKGGDSQTPRSHDPARDSYTLPLIRRAIQRGVPLLAICRGFQELNVALGGSLHQQLQSVPGRFDHRPDKTRPIAERFGPAHMVRHRPEGFFQTLMACDESLVNSYHEQGINHLAAGLEAESAAPDGTIEAVTVRHAKAFALGIQWHPEWDVENSETSQAIFGAFREACVAHHQRKLQHNSDDQTGALAASA